MSLNTRTSRPPELTRTVQKPLTDGLDNAVSALPPGMDESQRTLVDDLVKLFTQFEQDEFANPDRNTARNRTDRMVKELSKMAYESLEKIVKDNDIMGAVKEAIQNRLTGEGGEDSGEEGEIDLTGLAADLMGKLGEVAGKELSKRDREWMKKLDSFTDSLGLPRLKGKQKKQKGNKKAQASSGEEQKDNRKTPPSIPVDKKGEAQLAEAVEAGDKAGQLAKNILESGKIGEEVNRIIDNFDLKKSKVVQQLTVSLSKSQGRIAEFRAKMEAVGKTQKLDFTHGKRNFKTIALGGMMFAVWSVGRGVEKAGQAVKTAVLRTASAIGSLGRKISDFARGTVDTLLVKPTGMIKKMLKRSLVPLILLALLSPQVMYWLGFAFGKMKLAYEKDGIAGVLSMIKNAVMNVLNATVMPIIRKIKDFFAPHFEAFKGKVTKEWDDFKKRHPGFEKVVDATGESLAKAGEAAGRLGGMVKGWVLNLKTIWKTKKEQYENAYKKYVEDQMKEGKALDEIMQKDEFMADMAHKDLSKIVDDVTDGISQVMEPLAKITKFAVGVVNFFLNNKWLINIVNVIVGMQRQGSGNPASSILLNAIGLVYGPFGRMIGNFISYMIEKATIYLFNLFRREQAKLQSSDEMMDVLFGEGVVDANVEKLTGFLKNVDVGSFSGFKVLSESGEELTRNEDKKNRVMELFKKFNETMMADMAETDNIVSALNRATLVSDNAKNLDYANSLEDIFSKTGIVGRSLTRITYFEVPSMLGITQKAVEEKMASLGGVNHDSNWWTTHKTLVNILGLNLVRLRLYILSSIYNEISGILGTMDKASDEEKLKVLYSMLSREGAYYRKISESLKGTEAGAKDILEILSSKKYDFDKEGEGMKEMMGDITNKGSFTLPIQDILSGALKVEGNKAVEQVQATMASTGAHISGGAKAVRDINTEMWDNLSSGEVLKTAHGAVELSFMSTRVATAATIGAVMTGKDERNIAVAKKFGEQGGYGMIDLGRQGEELRGVGHSITAKLFSGGEEAKKLAETLESLRKGEKMVDGRLVKDIAEAFKRDLRITGYQGFREVSKLLDEQMKIAEAQNRRLTLQDFEKIYATNDKLKAGKEMAQATYSLYQSGDGEFGRMMEFMDKIGEGLIKLSTSGELYSDKWKDKEINEIVQEFLHDEMESQKLSEAQRSYVMDYLRYGFKDRSTELKSSIANKIKLNQSILEEIRKLEGNTPTEAVRK